VVSQQPFPAIIILHIEQQYHIQNIIGKTGEEVKEIFSITSVQNKYCCFNQFFKNKGINPSRASLLQREESVTPRYPVVNTSSAIRGRPAAKVFLSNTMWDAASYYLPLFGKEGSGGDF